MSVLRGNANKTSALSCPIHSSCQPYIPLPALEPEAGEKSSFLGEKNGAPFLVSSFEPLRGRNRSGGGKLPGDRVLSFIPTHGSMILHRATRPLQPSDRRQMHTEGLTRSKRGDFLSNHQLQGSRESHGTSTSY